MAPGRQDRRAHLDVADRLPGRRVVEVLVVVVVVVVVVVMILHYILTVSPDDE